MSMIPPTATAQEHRMQVVNGRVVVYEPAKLQDARQKLEANLIKHRPEAPFTDGIRLTVKWLFPKGTKHKDGEYRITRPDTDNLQKLLKDFLNNSLKEITVNVWSYHRMLVTLQRFRR